MLKIGDFSRLTRISVRMLRHYSKMGLLQPAWVDSETGYRYYIEEQLPLANQIQALKDMGFSLACVCEILKEYKDKQSLEQFLSIQILLKKEEMKKIQQQLLKLESSLEQLHRASIFSPCQIAIQKIPERTVVYVRAVIPSYDQESVLWEELARTTKNTLLRWVSPSYSVAVYHFDHDELGIDVEVQKPVQEELPTSPHLNFSFIEQTFVASLTFQGGYRLLAEANQVISDWICKNGYFLSDSFFNIYHVSPETEPRSENWITQVCFPIHFSSPYA